jgi:hypothetical protein
MTSSLHPARLAALLAGAAVLVAAPAADARDDSFTQPVAQAMTKSKTRELLGDIVLRFGSASAQGADVLPDIVTVTGSASAYDDTQRTHPKLGDETTCLHAFQDAVGQMASEARRIGAASVVGIVSDFKGDLVDDPRNYNCHAGIAKSYVTLKGHPSKTVLASRREPPATGFAALDDVKAVPISDDGRERYRYFLTLPKPRAFTVYEDGGWRFYSKDPEAMTKALDYCARQGRRCWLYAVDDRVVWSPDVTRRIASSTQLQDDGEAAPAAALRDDHQ